MSTALKCDKVSSVAMPTEEWELIDRCAAQMGTSRNDLMRRCVTFTLSNLIVADLSSVNLDRITKEARGELLTSNKVRWAFTGR